MTKAPLKVIWNEDRIHLQPENFQTYLNKTGKGGGLQRDSKKEKVSTELKQVTSFFGYTKRKRPVDAWYNRFFKAYTVTHCVFMYREWRPMTSLKKAVY